ncbi:zwei Ig domain protein zig-8-like isoform X2 [Babylonia areolata]|uniref:zwei Ig domain protein zig-8-like isoform X2 n=1 Tax=Babylonia areolata TaxID=304850 RepID=UPI003FCF48BF
MDSACLACLLLLLLLVPLITGSANSYVQDANKLSVPAFLPTQAHYQYTVGDTAVLQCAVENLGKKSVSWRKMSDGQVLTVGFVSFLGNPRYGVEHPPGSTLWNLIIRDLKPSDAGVYECQVSAKVRHLRHHVTLLVREEVTTKKIPKPNIRITGADFVDEGKRLYLICNATATEQPPEDLDWFREGNRLQTSEEKGIYIRKFVTLSTSTIVSILEIKHARLDDAGVYVCRTSSLDVTSFRVNVLNGDKNNVKRGTEVDHTQETGRQVDSAAVELHHHLHVTAVVTSGTELGETIHSPDTGHHVVSNTAEIRHHPRTSVFTAGIALLIRYLPCPVT